LLKACNLKSITRIDLKINKNITTLTKYFILIFIISFYTIINAQQKTNLDLFNSLIDSSVVKILKQKELFGNIIVFKFSQDVAYPTFRNRILAHMGNEFSVVSDQVSNESIPVINYSIENASVSYGKMFRDGFWGDYLVPREIKLKGLYSIVNEKVNVFDFNYLSIDTVSADNLDTIENKSLPFTEGEHPSEPLFSSLFEPLIAVGSAALVVILFFTIRSK